MNTEELRHALRVKPLPPGKDVVSIFADFLRYLFLCTKQYIVETNRSGASTWESVADQIEVVLSHPNGWEGLQQGKMRQAAVLAGLVPDNAAGHARVHFVTEGEASMHYCIEHGLAASVLKVCILFLLSVTTCILRHFQDGETVIIVDAGGGTVDLTTYTFITAAPIVMEEVAPPACTYNAHHLSVFHLSSFLQVSWRVRQESMSELRSFSKVRNLCWSVTGVLISIRADKLAKSKYGNDEDISAMIESFESSTKPTFRNENERSCIKFGLSRDNDRNFGIRSGQLFIEG